MYWKHLSLEVVKCKWWASGPDRFTLGEWALWYQSSGPGCGGSEEKHVPAEYGTEIYRFPSSNVATYCTDCSHRPRRINRY